MKALQNVLNSIIKLQGITVSIKDRDGTTYTDIEAAISNYFRFPSLDEQAVSSGRQYVVSEKDLGFIPVRGDLFIISATEYYAISTVQEMVALGNRIGYRLTLS